MGKWYNIELSPDEWGIFRRLLIEDGESIGEPWKFEASGAGDMVHIEILCKPSELGYLNEMIESCW